MASVPHETNVPTAGVPPIVAQNPKWGAVFGGGQLFESLQSGAGVGPTPMGRFKDAPKDVGVNPRSFLVNAVGCPESWLIKVKEGGVTVLSKPKYTGSVACVTITGSLNVIIACGVDKFGDAASWNPNWIPSWAAVGGGFVPVPGMPVTVPARQPCAAATLPLQVAVRLRVAVTGVSLLSAFNITSGNVKLPTGPLTNDLLVHGG